MNEIACNSNPPELITYVKDNKGNAVGCLLAVKKNNYSVDIGWSLCHSFDRFDKSKAKLIAKNRANSGKVANMESVAGYRFHKIHPQICRFFDRCSKYFKVSPTNINLC